MFYAPIGRFAPNLFNDSYGTPHQLSFHFLKKDATTGETREVGINDDLRMIRLLENGTDWTYVNLKDVLFFMNSYTHISYPINTRTIFSRDKNKFYTYYGNYQNGFYEVTYSCMPNFIHLSHNDKDYIVDAKRLNTKNLTLDPIWVSESYYRNQLIDKINELLTKYDIRKDSSGAMKYNNLYYKQINENTWIISSSHSFYRCSILVDGKTPFPDCVLARARYDSSKLEYVFSEDEYNALLSTYGDSEYDNYTDAIIPIIHKDYFQYDETKRIGTELTGKFDLYPKSYIKELPQQPIILEPMHNLGLIVNVFSYARKGGDLWAAGDGSLASSNFVIFSNILATQSPHQFDGYKEFDLTFYCGDRSVKRRHSKRIRPGSYELEYMPRTLSIECSADNLINVCGYTVYNNSTVYPMILMKDADIHRTPKNKDYDYYGSFNKVPVDLYKDTGIDKNSLNYPWANGARNIAVLQKGFTGKTTMSNPDDYKTLSYGSPQALEENDNMTFRDFRDWEMDFALQQDYVVSNNAPTKTRAPYKFIDWPQIGYTHDGGLAAAADNILVDAQFDYFNDILRDAPIYIVDTKILKTLGLSTPRYHRFMPNRCIWFEVNDLYLYDDTGKITGYNNIYATTDGTFTYALASFNFFKVKLYENVSVVTYDTQKDVMEDFTYATNTETGAVLDPVLQVCDDISEFHIVMWVPLQKAILRIGNIKLNTEVA